MGTNKLKIAKAGNDFGDTKGSKYENNKQAAIKELMI